MTDPEVTVTLTDSEFSVGEIQEFLEKIRSLDGMPANALITVTHDCDPKGGRGEYTLSASTANRTKASE